MVEQGAWVAVVVEFESEEGHKIYGMMSGGRGGRECGVGLD